ncbi:MAG TPA: hypothetical protein VGJ77_17620, partial [Gaiellaceae bacterium]
MRVGVPKETAPGEERVALVPDIVARLDGIDVVVEHDAGIAAGFDDDAYTEAGGTIVDDAWRGVDVVVKVAKPSSAEIQRMHDGQVLIAFLQPLTD